MDSRPKPNRFPANEQMPTVLQSTAEGTNLERRMQPIFWKAQGVSYQPTTPLGQAKLEPLNLYLFTSPHTISTALVRETKGVQNSLYYTSQPFWGVEARYL